MNLNFYQYVNQKGANNPAAKITEDTAHSICVLLSTTSLSIEQISRKTKSTYDVVREIYRRKTWTHISSYYKSKDRKPKGVK